MSKEEIMRNYYNMEQKIESSTDLANSKINEI